MDQSSNGVEPYRFANPKRKRIYELFRILGDVPASMYRDACILIEGHVLVGSKVHLVTHLFRELEGQLRSVLREPETLEELEDKKGKMAGREIKKSLKTAGIPDDDKLMSGCENLVSAIARTSHRDEVENVLRQVEIPSDHPIAKSWLALITMKDVKLHGLAHTRRLGWNRTWNEDLEDIISRWEEVFYFVLTRFQASYAKYFERLDDLLKKESPSTEDITQLKESVPNNVHAMGYFFERLDKLGWLNRLHKAKFFVGPSDPDPETRIYPRWPPGWYLARMAKIEPSGVMNIILAVDDKLNPYVQHDLIAAAVKIPVKESVRIVPKIKEWLDSPQGQFVVDDCAMLLQHFISYGELSASLDLGREVLSPARLRNIPHNSLPIYCDGLIRKCLPKLVDVGNMETFRMVCDLLEESISLEFKHSIQEGQDLSYLWRLRIESDRRRESYEPKNMFLTALRDASIKAIESDSSLLEPIIEELENRGPLIFQRLVLHILCEFPELGIEFSAERLKRVNQYDSIYFYNEYYRLARSVLPLISLADRGNVLDEIAKESDIEELRPLFERNGLATDDATLQSVVKRKVRDRLGELKPVLEESRLEYLGTLEAVHGPCEPLITEPREIETGCYEPEGMDNFGSMTVEEIVGILQSCGFPDDSLYRSPEKLFSKLVQAIAESPARFALEADRFEMVDPYYIRHVLHAFQQVLRFPHPSPFTWEQIIGLCAWVVNQGTTIPGRTTGRLPWDLDWSLTRSEILNLLKIALKSSANPIPFNLREHVWSVLAPLTIDPDPNVQKETEWLGVDRRDGHRTDEEDSSYPGDVAINSVRSEAISTVIDYAIWVKNNLGRNFEDGQPERLGLMPEVREVLEHHLDPQNDPSIAVAYLYGRKLSKLQWIDAGWVRNNKNRIFPRDPASKERRAAAWEGYLMNGSLRYDILKEEYATAVDMAGKDPAETGHFMNPDKSLGMHLLQLYLGDQVELNSSKSILNEFWDKASDRLRKQVLREFSLRIRNNGDPNNKWRMFWEFRINAIKQSARPEESMLELKEFGYWFETGIFENKWALDQLRRILEMTDGHIEGGAYPVERLSHIPLDFIAEILECAILLGRGSEENLLRYSKESVARIYAAAMDSGSDEIKKKAEELRSILLSKDIHCGADSAL
jgi:hypothetical protein